MMERLALAIPASCQVIGYCYSHKLPIDGSRVAGYDELLIEQLPV